MAGPDHELRGGKVVDALAAMETAASARLVRPKAPTRVRTRLLAGRSPRPGIERRVLDWDDLVHDDMPVRPRGGAYVVPLHTQVGSSLRWDFQTRVVVAPDGAIEVEEVLAVRPRLALLALMRHRERQRGRQRRWLQRLDERATVRALRAVEVGGWRRRMHMALGRFERRHGRRVVGWTVALLQWFTELPDRMYQRFLSAYAHLAHPLGRKTLRRGISEPRILTVEGKSVLLLLATLAIVGAFLLANTLVTLAAPGIASAYRDQEILFTLGLATSLFLPVPFEPALQAFLDEGWIVFAFAFVNAIASRVVGAWLVFFVGDEVNGKMEALGAKWPRLGRAVAALERGAQKYGFWIAVALVAIPLSPDTIVLYILGTARMPMRTYLWGIGIGTALRYVIYLGMVFYGAQVVALFA